jgi:DNA (cytosine-5)-methyltransferase 1
MKYFSLFTGIGGFELGIQQAYKNKKAKCVGYSEIEKSAIKIYQYHYPDQKNYGDIRKIKTKTLPDFDLLVGGFPCQSFSIAGKRLGFKDTRGTLFFEIARIIKQKRPRFLLLENVKGLLSHDNGKTFAVILSTLYELGYDTEWQVLNSKNFGVPQNRERVFIVGHLRKERATKIFPLTETNKETNLSNTIRAGGRGSITKKHSWDLVQLAGGSQGYRVYDPKGLSTTLASQAGGVGAKTGLYAIPVLTPDRINKRQNGRRVKGHNEPSFTLTSQDKHGVFDGVTIRRLTPIECGRLQGFPDNWTANVSDTARYKCLGNAVTVNVVREVITRLFLTK